MHYFFMVGLAAVAEADEKCKTFEFCYTRRNPDTVRVH